MMLENLLSLKDKIALVTGGAAGMGETPDIEKRMLSHTPLCWLDEPEDIAIAVLFFASPISS